MYDPSFHAVIHLDQERLRDFNIFIYTAIIDFDTVVVHICYKIYFTSISSYFDYKRFAYKTTHLFFLIRTTALHSVELLLTSNATRSNVVRATSCTLGNVCLE